MHVKLIRFLTKALLTVTMASTAVMASTFVDIDKVQNHKFPDEIRKLGIPVTLLHKHQHAHGYLVYAKDYRTSFYRDNVSNYNACSWYLDEDGKVIPYEYCEEKIKYDAKEIRQRLWDIQDTGHDIYGTTVRPVQGIVELETEDGHVYVSEKEMNDTLAGSAVSETVIAHGPISNLCIIVTRCVYGGCQGHRKDMQHYFYGRRAIKMIDDLLVVLDQRAHRRF